MRKHIARAEIAKQVLNSNGGGVLGRRPHVLAMLVKLQVNIEGGFGPTWKQEHATTVKLLSKSIGKALESPASVLAFRDALHNHQAVPCNKGSRAFAALAFAWRINSLHDVEVLVQTVAEREGIEGTKSDVQASMVSVEGGSAIGTRSMVRESRGGFICSLQSKCERDSVSESGAGGAAEADANALAAAAELAPALSSLRLERDRDDRRLSHQSSSAGSKAAESNRSESRADYASSKVHEDSGGGDCRWSSSSSDNDQFSIRGGGKAADSNPVNNPNTRGLEMDEMDEILLGLDRGPPPRSFYAV